MSLMASVASPDSDALRSLDPFALLERLRLTTGKAAEFCGVSRRQLCYWTDIGLVNAIEQDPEEEGDADEDAASRRVYDFTALYKIMLIKQALQRVKGLRRAAKETDDFLQKREREAEELRSSIEKKREVFLTAQSDRLEHLARNLQEKIGAMNNREELLSLLGSLASLQQLAQAINGGQVVLEEDPGACLRLASLLEQAEIRMEPIASA
jgi:DNA-binding transcriptional MerR regulator